MYFIWRYFSSFVLNAFRGLDRSYNLRKVMDIFSQENAHAKWHSSFCINFRDSGTLFILKALAVLTAMYVIYIGRTGASSSTPYSNNDSK